MRLEEKLKEMIMILRFTVSYKGDITMIGFKWPDLRHTNTLQLSNVCKILTSNRYLSSCNLLYAYDHCNLISSQEQLPYTWKGAKSHIPESHLISTMLSPGQDSSEAEHQSRNSLYHIKIVSYLHSHPQ